MAAPKPDRFDQAAVAPTPHAGHGRGEATAWPAIAAAMLCGVAVSMNIGKLPIALPAMRADLGLSLVAAGWLAAMFNTIAMAGGVFAGILADRSGALRFCVGAMIASGAGALVAIAVPGEGALLASRAIEGVGFIAVAVAAPALVSAAATSSQRRLALAIWSCYMPSGIALGMLLAPPLLAVAGWRALWTVAFCFTVAAMALLVAQRRRYDGAPASGGATFADVGAALRKPAAWLLAVTLACFAVQLFAIVTWLPTFLREQRGVDATTAAALTAFAIAIGMPGNLVGGKLVQRGGHRGRIVAASMLGCVLCSVGILSAALPDGLRYALCLALSLVGGIVPAAVISSSAVLADKPQQVSTLQGLYMQASNVGQFAGALAVAWAVSAAGGAWSAALWVTVPAGLVGAGAALALARRQLHSHRPTGA